MCGYHCNVHQNEINAAHALCKNMEYYDTTCKCCFLSCQMIQRLCCISGCLLFKTGNLVSIRIMCGFKNILICKALSWKKNAIRHFTLKSCIIIVSCLCASHLVFVWFPFLFFLFPLYLSFACSCFNFVPKVKPLNYEFPMEIRI